MKSTLTVTGPATSRDLTVLETVKSELGITDNANDERLSRWISQASGMIESYCRRVFAAETVTEVFRINASIEELTLSRFPVRSVALVSVDGVALESDDYEIDKINGILSRLDSDGDDTICWPYGKLLVSYSAGYELLQELPQDIERACLELVKLMSSSSSRDPLAKRIEIPGIRTVDYWVGSLGSNGAMPPQVVAALDPYRNVRV